MKTRLTITLSRDIVQKIDQLIESKMDLADKAIGGMENTITSMSNEEILGMFRPGEQL